jgi:hypothetical protein
MLMELHEVIPMFPLQILGESEGRTKQAVKNSSNWAELPWYH